MERLKAQKLIANLKDAEVRVLGTESPGRSKNEWAQLRQLWPNYFIESQSRLVDYSLLRAMRLGGGIN
jgi:hypothetical protein